MPETEASKLAIYSKGFKGVPDGWRKLRRCNFIVGENSSGKSSFLELLQVIDSREHNLFFDVLGIVPELNSPFDVLSRISGTKDLTIGYFSKDVSTDDQDKSVIETFGKLTLYSKKNDELILQKILVSFGETVLLLKRTSDGINIFKKKAAFDLNKSNTENAEAFAQYLTSIRGKPTQSLKVDWERSPNHGIYWIRALNTIHQKLSEETEASPFVLSTPIGCLHHGPIRSQTRRMYYEAGIEFSPSGEHYPQLLSGSSRVEKSKLEEIVNQFGKDSGLFDSVSVVNVKTGVGDKPFAIVLEKSGKSFYVDELGYGVGQILPIVTDLAFSPSQFAYLIEQPELHLHPRAQSTLGAMFYSACQAGRRLVVETHSDYVLDRFRMECAKEPTKFNSQIIYFDKNDDNTNRATDIEIHRDGKLGDLPAGYREFFLREELNKFELL